MDNRKEIQDKLNWDNINQLHNAVSNFSRQSFDIKKLWITVEISVITLLSTIKVESLDFIVFIIELVTIFFYLLDSMTYYYQDKLRDQMEAERNAIRKRYRIKYKSLEQEKSRIFKALFNWSHLLYYVVLVLGIFYLLHRYYFTFCCHVNICELYS